MSAGPLHVPAGHERGEELSRLRQAFYAVVQALVSAAAKIWFRLEIQGQEHLPATGAVIVSPIHRSNLDTPILGAITRRRLRYMGKESLWRSRFGGWFLTTLGGFPVQRGTADRDALRACMTVIGRGEPLVMFPEGTRQFGPEIAEMFDGPAYVACRTGTPILPVGIGGSEAAMPKGAKWVRPVKMVIVIGAPIVPPEPAEGTRVPRRVVRDVTAQLAEAIQALFDEAQALAGSPNRHA